MHIIRGCSGPRLVRTGAGATGLSLLAALTGCSTYWPMSADLQARIEKETDGLTPKVTDDDAVAAAAQRIVDGKEPAPEAFALPDDAGLDDYVAIALRRNPRIRARIRDIEALGLRVPQVTSLNDPMLDVMPGIGDMTETAAGQVQAQGSVSQGIPWPGKLVAMGRVAEQVVRIGFENLRSERLAVAAEVEQAYYGYYLAGIEIDVTADLQSLLQRAHDVADAGFRAGRTSQQDVLRAEVELYSLSNDLITRQQDLVTARAHLNVLMDRAVQAPIAQPKPFDPDQVSVELPALLERAVADSPELAGLREGIQRDLEAAALARQQYLPDFSLSALYSFIGGGISPVATGADAWALGFGTTLPIWLHRIRAGVLQRNAETLATSERWRSTRNEIALMLQTELVRVGTGYRSAVLFRDAIVPRARQAVDVAERGYEAGDVDFTTLIESWQRLLDLTLGYHRALATLESDLAELERVAGGELPRSEP